MQQIQTGLKTDENITTTVYLVRHGTTSWNQSLRYQGVTDNPLDEIGERQGALLTDYFRDIPIGLGVTSPLRRAQKTLSYCLVSQDHPVPVLTEPSVIEFNFGELEGLTRDEIMRRSPSFYRHYILDEERSKAAAPGGDTLVGVYERMRDGITRIVRDNPGKNIVVASHGTAIQTFLCYASGIPSDRMRRFRLFNVSVSCIDFDAACTPRVRFIGDIHHIPEELQYSYGPIS